MTKIERLGQQYSPIAIRGVINALVDKVNEQEEKIRALHGRAQSEKAFTHDSVEQPAAVVEDLLVPDEIEFMKRGTEFCLLLEKGGLKWLSYNDHWGWTVDGRTRDNIEGHIVKCRLIPCKLEDVKVGEWVYANYELCLDEQDKYYLCIGDKLFCYIDEGVKEIAWGAMTNKLYVHYLYKVQPIE